jgi:hypothetical protein
MSWSNCALIGKRFSKNKMLAVCIRRNRLRSMKLEHRSARGSSRAMRAKSVAVRS